MSKIHKGDKVIVLVGKDKNKVGEVLAIGSDRVVVSGVAISKKAVKPNPALGIVGGLEDVSRSIHISNVALVDDAGKPSKVSIKVEGKKRLRVLKSTGAVL